jgi:hypothetical protein
MATASYEVLVDNVNLKVIQWTLTDANPGGQPFVVGGHFPDKSIQVFGTFGSGGTVKLQGTNEPDTPSNWDNLDDPQGSEISLAAAGIEEVLQNTLQIRPYLSAGTGVTLTVLVCLKG